MLPKMNHFPFVLALALGMTSGLVACSSTPISTPVLPPAPIAFKEARLFVPANPAAADVPDEWWTLFNDPVLNKLQTRLVAGNPNLQASAAAVATAQAALGTSRASLMPAVNLSGGVTRSGNVSGSTVGTTATSYTLQGGLASWELDLWGRLSANVDAASAHLQSSRDTLAATRLSLQATLVQTYFSLRAAQAMAALIAQTVESYEKSLQLTQNRYQGGVAAASDVAQAQTQLKSAQAQQLEVRLQRDQLEHALALLLGLAPSDFEVLPSPLLAQGGLPTPPVVPSQLPSTLLERRPDIAAAERQVVAANAQINAAQAAFFPAVTLSASSGFRNGDLGNLLQTAHRFWSIGPSVALSVFDGGARDVARDAARANYDQTVATYQQTVLVALQEVEDNLVAAAVLQDETVVQQAALSAARRALDIVQNQYKAGTVSYLNVVAAQTAALTAESNLLTVRNRHLAAVNQLLKNIAGRWS